MSLLKDKVALVTGASRGIGASIAQRLAKDGASVAITYNSSPAKAEEVVKAIEADGGKAIAIKADSASPQKIAQAIEETVSRLGRLDILVNNAGIGTMGPIEQTTLEDLDQIIAVNLRGVFIAIQTALKFLPEGGRIINIGSSLAERAPFPGTSAYTMTKAGIAGLTRALAHEVGAKGITINNVQPGPVDTDMNPDGSPLSDIVKGMTAIRRYGRTSEIASLVAHLASPEAGFITGANLTADGGTCA